MGSRQQLLNVTTATTRERAQRRRARRIPQPQARRAAGTNRGDGWWHVTPIWYLWEDGRFYHTLGNSRGHLKNIRRDDHVTLCVDVDPRVDDPTLAPRAVMCFGHAELVDDEATCALDHGEDGDALPRAASHPSSTRRSGSRDEPPSSPRRSAGWPGIRARAASPKTALVP